MAMSRTALSQYPDFSSILLVPPAAHVRREVHARMFPLSAGSLWQTLSDTAPIERRSPCPLPAKPSGF